MNFELAKKEIDKEGISLVFYRDGKILYKGDGLGIGPVIKAFDENSEVFKNSFAIDRLIGKAVAMIFHLGGVKKVYGKKISKNGLAYLEKNHIKVEFGEIIEEIPGRKTGICPMEERVLNIEDPREALLALKEKLEFLKKEQK